MADTDILRGYRRADPPTIPGSEQRYLSDQLRAIETAVERILIVLKKLDARMVAHGI